MKNDLSSLNHEQILAVTSSAPSVLVLAGAGSGKTRVIVHRVCHYLEQGITHDSIMAVTFTNKAANELKWRINEALSHVYHFNWIGTFHGLAHKLLRLHYEPLGLPKNFQILDADDQYRLIRRTAKAMSIDEREVEPKTIQRYINKYKEKGIVPNEVPAQHSALEEAKLAVYKEYERICEQNGYVDFGGILLKATQLLKTHSDIRQLYQKRFAAILVDEFQDTNFLQYEWLKLLSNNKTHMTAVGDDDQSIYGWRGAKVENLNLFTQEFPKVEIIRLEQNYRSSQNILNAANSLIACNKERMGKQLRTDAKQGELITVYEAYDDRDEAIFIISRLQHCRSQGESLNDCAILYRSNAQSRLIEEMLVKANLPYKIYGGLRFFDRAEIKDAMAYLRLVVHPNDDAAFERVINVPKRGVGERSLIQVRQFAKSTNMSLREAALSLVEKRMLSPTAQNGIRKFAELIAQFNQAASEHSLPEVVKMVIEQSGLSAQFEGALKEKEKNRFENLNELANAAYEFIDKEETYPDTITATQHFLAHAALDAGELSQQESAQAVSLMTLHSAKGLEFKIVFIAGLEEGLFPHAMALNEGNRLEEERRLCYVGITRAMQKLYLSYAERRIMHGFSEGRTASRFIRELPPNLLDEIRRKAFNTTTASKHSTFSQPLTTAPFSPGQKVVHAKFGEGVVMQLDGAGEDAKVAVQFSSGVKWLILSLARLKSVS